ncbi:sulfotransferase family 2 domain-containing protein [Gilvibacter sp.]|uniref:sulfotransferase family 2 domain-containing protein n=1 Tax=Gilvibacter sp. TaxID=2729997 RepID=UPI003F49DB5E
MNRYLDEIHSGDKPVFIHINKTAGSSIAQSLGITAGHYTLHELELAYQQRFKKLLPLEVPVYTVIRNPFDKVVSQYSYRKQTDQNNLATKPLSFRDWVEAVYDRKDPAYRDRELMFIPQTEWLRSERLKQVKYIHFEQLHEQVQPLLKKYGKQDLAWKKRSDHAPYRTYYDQHTQAIIEREFASDLKTFNYEF